MPEFCEELNAPSSTAFNAWLTKQTHLKYGFGCVAVLSWMIGLGLIFIWRRKEAKSRFIWVLWTLISMVNLVLIAEITFSVLTEIANNREDDKYFFYYERWQWLKSLNTYLVSITHWVLGIKYFEVVFKFPLIMAPQQDEIKAKHRRLRCSIWIANVSYYSIMVLWYFLYRLFSYQLLVRLALEIVFKVAFQMSPAALLVFSIQKLRKSIRNLRGFSLKEKLMCVHTVLFVCSIVANVAAIASFIISNNNTVMGNWSKYCRSVVSEFDLSDIVQVTNIVILWLITFMSLQLIKPLTREWQVSSNEDLVDELDQVLFSGDTEAAARASAMRLHSAALQDANRQIRFIQALLYKTGESSESQTSLHESTISITSAELRILANTNSDNSAMTNSDRELFDRVRREEAEKLDRSDVSIQIESVSLLSNED